MNTNSAHFKKEEIRMFRRMFNLIDERKPKKILLVCVDKYSKYPTGSEEREELLSMFDYNCRMVESVSNFYFHGANNEIAKYNELAIEKVRKTLAEMENLPIDDKNHFENLCVTIWKAFNRRLAEQYKFEAYLRTNGQKFSKYFQSRH